MVSYLLPYYIEEGKSQLVIGIGCTGGKHRSVTIAIQLYEHLKAAGYNAVLSHRDIQKTSINKETFAAQRYVNCPLHQN